MDTLAVFDFIVVGSGPSGVQSAQTLLEAGCSVLMLDVGVEESGAELPKNNFLDIRKNDDDQYKIWLGENFEGLPLYEIKTGAQLTPSRSFVHKLVDNLTPLHSKNFLPSESLAVGGLGAAWGLGSFAYSDLELKACGLPVKEMNEAYQKIADRIGIASADNNISKYTTNGLKNLLPPIDVDCNAKQLLISYQRKKQKLESNGFHLGKPSLALLTKNKGERKANAYNNLDFYDNEDDSVYRPKVTLKILKQYPKFKYINNTLVTSFTEDENVKVETLDIKTKSLHSFFSKKLILACNVLGTARIVLRSFGLYNFNLPILCNDYCYVPSILWNRLGKEPDSNCTATAQLFLLHDPHQNNFDVAIASLYSYSSLMMFRIAEQAPVSFKDARNLFKELMPAIVIAGIHMPDTLSNGKTIKLVKSADSFTGDVLEVDYQLSAEEQQAFAKRRSVFTKTLRQLGCLPLKKILPGSGSSIHYAGTLPYLNNSGQLYLLANGRLNNTKNVFVADGSGFSYLPAKGITLSLMANAHRTALNALQDE